MAELHQNSTAAARAEERRILPRTTLESLSYIDLGDSNGGIVLNVSEGGLAFRAAIPVMELRIPKLRFQLSGLEMPLEAEGRVAWTSDENRMVGISFLNLDAAARAGLKNWIANAANPPDVSVAAASTPVRRELAPIILIPPDLGNSDTFAAVPTESSPPVADIQVIEKPAATIVTPNVVPVSLVASAPAIQRSGLSLDAISIDALLPRIAREKPAATFGSMFSSRSATNANQTRLNVRSPRPIAAANQQLRAPVVVLIAATLVFAVWMLGRTGSLLPAFSDAASSSGMQNSSGTIVINHLTEIGVVDAIGHRRIIPWVVQQSGFPISSSPSVPRRTASATSTVNGDSSLERQAAADIAASSAADAHNVSQMWSLPRPGQSAAARSGSSAAQQSAPPAFRESAQVAPGALPSAMALSHVEPPPAPVNTPVKEQPISPSARLFSGSHSGVLIRRVEPIYPPKAVAEKIEGVVAMQVVVGKDGKIRGVKVLSGPKMLEDAAIDAVKLWRYEPAIVDGKLAESRQYIQLTFKLGSR